MKRLYIIISVLFLSILCAGCSEESKYEEAVTLYRDGNFAEAEELFYELGNYEDSEIMKNKSDIMEKLQGTYYYTKDGEEGFTIDKFDVLNWNEDTTLELSDDCTIARFYNKKFGDNDWEIIFKNFNPVLELDYKGVRLSYTRQD